MVRSSLAAALGLALLAGCGAGGTSAPVAQRETVERTATTVEGWREADPADLGLRPRRLRTLAREARAEAPTCFPVVRRNRLVGEWNWGTERTVPREVFSVTKSVTSALVGIADRQGLLDVDDPVSDYVEEWAGTDSATVTIRQLLSNSSGRFWSAQSDYGGLLQAPDRTSYAVGLEQQYPPGSAWAYNNAAIQVLDRVLTVATGETTADFAEQELFEPLGMTRSRMTADSSGASTNVFFGLQTTCLDLARFARLFLREGLAGDERLLARAWVRSSTQVSSTEHNAGYGWLWWINREGRLRGSTDAVDAQGQPVEERYGRLVPGAPASLHAALGLFGQVAMVDPRSRTLVVRIGGAGGDYGFADAARVVTWASRR